MISLVVELSHLLLKGNLRNLSNSKKVYLAAPGICMHSQSLDSYSYENLQTEWVSEGG